MTQQELIEQNVRMLIGDLQLQLIVARARIVELEQAEKDEMASKANGAAKEEKPREPDHLSQ
jgi:hypothetical protein